MRYDHNGYEDFISPQLAAMTGIYLAVKVFEPRKARIESFLDLGHCKVRAEHLSAMEEEMLLSLDWHVYPPTPWVFCKDLLRLTFANPVPPYIMEGVYQLARYLTELAQCDQWFVAKDASAMALASVAYAVEVHGSHQTSRSSSSAKPPVSGCTQATVGKSH